MMIEGEMITLRAGIFSVSVSLDSFIFSGVKPGIFGSQYLASQINKIKKSNIARSEDFVAVEARDSPSFSIAPAPGDDEGGRAKRSKVAA